MPWILDPAELRRRRELAGLTPTQAAKAVGLSRMTIYRHERPAHAPEWVHDESADRYALAYDTPVEQLGRKVGVDAGLAPPGDTVNPPVAEVGPHPRLTAAAVRKCVAAYRLYAGQRFTLTGNVAKYGDAPDDVARVLGGEPGACVRFRTVSADAEPVDTTVFTRSAEATRAVLDLAEARRPVVQTLSVAVEPISATFRGFPFFARKQGKSHFAFVLEDVRDFNGDAQLATRPQNDHAG